MEGSQMNEQLQSPPHLEPTPEWITARREHLVREIVASASPTHRPARRVGAVRRWRVAAVALAVLVLATGAALAATGFNLLDWIRSDNPSEAAFSIDTNRVYSGPAPETVSCGDPSDADSFGCKPGRHDQWVYTLYERVEARLEFTREAALAAVADAERAGTISHDLAEQVRADFRAVGDEFFRKIDLLRTVTMISSPHEVRAGVLLVPPADVPQFVTCEGADTSTYECRKLAASVVPVGAPIYGLVENDEWVEQAFQPEGPRDIAPLFEGLFGRPLTPAEERLVIILGTAGTSRSGVESEGPVEVAPAPPDG
jgi:hypothetical protein